MKPGLAEALAPIVAALLRQPEVVEALEEALAPALRAAMAAAVSDVRAKRPSVDLLNTEETCEALRVTRRALNTWRADGMPVHMLGDSPRYRLAEVLEWSARRRERSEAAE